MFPVIYPNRELGENIVVTVLERGVGPNRGSLFILRLTLSLLSFP